MSAVVKTFSDKHTLQLRRHFKAADWKEIQSDFYCHDLFSGTSAVCWKSTCHLCILELLLVELQGKGTVGGEGHSNWKVINLAIVGPVEKVRLCSSGLECRQFPEAFFWSLLGVVHAEMLPWVTTAVSVRLGFLFFRQRENAETVFC